MSQEKEPGTKNNKEMLFVSWDVDTTGRRLLDDICNIGAYCNDFSMQQYVMPYKDILLPMKRRHMLSTITIGVYRVLRDTITGKIVKTKSELFGLLDFIMKLEAQGKDRGVVLMCYERQKLAPYLLIEGLKRYELLDRFKAVVKGFANCYEFVKVNCAQTMVTYSLKTLAKILLDKEPKKLHDAFQRAKLVHEIVVHLSTGESSDPIKDLASKMTPYIQSLDDIEKELEGYKSMLNRQRTLKPIFEQMIKVSSQRKRAVILRQYLTDAEIDFQNLNLVFTEEKNMKEYLQSQIGDKLPEKDLTDLESVVTKYFENPEKSEPKPKPKASKKYSRDRSGRRDRSKSGKREDKKKSKVAENGVDNEKNDSHESGEKSTADGEASNAEAATETKPATDAKPAADAKPVTDTKPPTDAKPDPAAAATNDTECQNNGGSPAKESPQLKDARSPKADKEAKTADSKVLNVQC